MDGVIEPYRIRLVAEMVSQVWPGMGKEHEDGIGNWFQWSIGDRFGGDRLNSLFCHGAVIFSDTQGSSVPRILLIGPVQVFRRFHHRTGYSEDTRLIFLYNDHAQRRNMTNMDRNVVPTGRCLIA